MVKCVAPGQASHRGKPIEAADDGSCDLTRETLEEMRAHGFREWEAQETGQAAVDNAPASTTADVVETMSKQALMKALKGRAKGNLMAMSKDELKRRLRETAGAAADGGK